MKPEDQSKTYTRYKVLKPFEVEQAQVVPWFNFKGMGWLFKSDVSAQDLIDGGFIDVLVQINEE